jgi:hypothetical protein
VNLLREQKYSNWALLDQMIASRSWAEREASELTRANIPLRVGEFMLIRGVIALVLVVVGTLAIGWPGLAWPLALPGAETQESLRLEEDRPAGDLVRLPKV